MDSYSKYKECRNELHEEYQRLVEFVGNNKDLSYEEGNKFLCKADGVLKAIYILDKHYG